MSTFERPRAEEIFIHAIGLDESGRGAYLESACRGDAELRREVDALLQASESSSEYFNRLPDRLGVASLLRPRTLANQEPGARLIAGEAGQQFGHYTLTGLAGSGGMGAVWRAVRNDGRFEGAVAVKLLSRTASTAALERFRLEARYLAKLSHSNIARLLDAGIGSGEQPYLVLEYVQGLPIDQYCDEHSLPLTQRIRLFLQVLDAVAHAHAHLIVHRDIKPSNVQVTADGSVKLLDFGVAKLLTDDAAPATDGLTRELGAALTPEFAAPEQLNGSAITTSTDIYSLGLLLWLMATGDNPRKTADVRSLEELRELANKEFRTLLDSVTHPTSLDQLANVAARRSTNSSELLRSLRGDLDSIVRKAVAVDPRERYATAADFAQDLRRYLSDEPVSAQASTVAYRARKFVRRHRGGVLVGALTLFVIFTTAAIAVWQSVEARKQRDYAHYQQQRVQGTNEFLMLLLGELGPEGKPLTLVELLDRGVGLLDRQFGAEETFIARTLYDVSVMYATLGNVEQQAQLLDRSARMAASLGDRDLLGAVRCAQARAEIMSNPQQAQQHLSAGQSAIASLDSVSPEAQQECHRAQAQVFEAAGDRQGALAALESALAAIEASPTPSGASRAVVLNDLSEQYYKADRINEALATNAELLDTLDETGRGGTLAKVIYLVNRAAILSRAGEVAAAAAAQQDAMNRIKLLESAGRAPVAVVGHYANSLFRLARYDEALALFKEGRQSAAASGNDRWIAQHDLMIGKTLARMGRSAEAETHLSAAESVYRKTPAANERLLDQIALVRVEASLQTGDLITAQSDIAEILRRLDYPSRKDSPGLSSALWTAAQVALGEKKWQEAEQYASDGMQAASRAARDPDLSADVGQALVLRAKARLGIGDRVDAKEDLRRALVSLTNGFGADHPETSEARQLDGQL